MGGHAESRAVRILRGKTAGAAALGFLLLGIGFTALARALPAPAACGWFALASSGWIYFIFLLWTNLEQNRVEAGPVFDTLGPANLLTIGRAALMASFMGFLAIARPHGAPAWLPGSLYLAAALPDFVDGILARRTGRVTRLGEILDLNVDSAGVFAAAVLAVRYGIVPWWYLPIGLARYLFVIGVRLRGRFGLPVRELPPSIRRRGFAALKMGFMFVVLFPVFGPPATHLAAAAFGAPFAVGFLWDWGLVTGRIRPGTGGPDSAAVRAVTEYLPVLLRAAAVWLTWLVAGPLLSVPEASGIGLLQIGTGVLIGLGVTTHTAAMLAAGLLGAGQNLVPLDASGRLLVFVLVGLIFLGGGRFALLAVEERLVARQIGDPD
jgi:CDP-diacylglycerol--glycerol-3-phosphate 3-phosphatidyltransferase